MLSRRVADVCAGNIVLFPTQDSLEKLFLRAGRHRCLGRMSLHPSPVPKFSKLKSEWRPDFC